MNSKIKLTLALLFIAMSINFQLAAQHTNGWFRVTGSLFLNDKWRTDAEVQGRWQNGLNNANPLQEKLLFSYRQWVYYKHSNTLQFGLSPFAYYTLYKIIQEPADYSKPPDHEYRASISAEFRQCLIDNLDATDKTMLEYRVFDRASNILRLRNKPGLEYKINTMLTSKLSYEILLNVASVNMQHFFDHQRTSVSLEFRMSKVAMEIGYMRINRLPVMTETMIGENAFFINLGYTLNSKNREAIKNVGDN